MNQKQIISEKNEGLHVLLFVSREKFSLIRRRHPYQ